MLTVDFTHLPIELEELESGSGLQPTLDGGGTNFPSIDADELPRHKQMIAKMIARHSQQQPPFAKLAEDIDNLQSVKEFTKENGYKYNHIVQVGLGGSILGADFLVKTLAKKTENSPFVHIVDNVDPFLIKELEEQIDLSSTLFIIVTKSGTTPETVALFSYFKRLVENHSLALGDHFVFVTDPTNNMLRQISEVHSIKTFDIPIDVGGRFSVLSNAGLILAAFAGIDIEMLLQGAGSYYAYSLQSEKNEVYNYAIAHNLLYQQGVGTSVYFGYSNKFKPFGDWITQLVSESLGKSENTKGDLVYKGLTPLAVVGSSAQHSILQLMNEGPPDKLTTFIQINSFGLTQEIPKINDPNLDYLSFHSFEKLLHTEMEGTRDSLTLNHRPSITIKINTLDAYHVGALIMFFELYIMIMGELFDIDVYNQPGVEASKRLVREKLSPIRL